MMDMEEEEEEEDLQPARQDGDDAMPGDGLDDVPVTQEDAWAVIR